MAHVARAAGVLPLLAAVVAAAALGGAAVFTVSQAACPDPGHFVRQGVSAKLVGGCMDKADLPEVATNTGPATGAAGQARP
jgi:hypothetical protein